MVKEILPPRIRMELLHSNIWWLDWVALIDNGFVTPKVWNVTKRVFDDV